MASRTSTDPIEILLEMGVDLDNLSEEEDYLSALMEAIATIEFKTKGKGDARSAALRQEVIKIRKGKRKPQARKTKISTNALKRGSATGTNVAPKALPTSAIVTYQASEAEEDGGKKKKRKPREKNLIADIAKSVVKIADILKQQYNVKKKSAEFDRKKAEQEKRALQKSKLSKGFEALVKGTQKVIAPVQSLLSKVFGFLFNLLLGKFIMKLLDWIGNPKNREKFNNVVRFLKDNWPKLIALYLVFGNSIGRFILGLTKTLIGGAVKLTVAIAKLLAAKKLVGGLRARRLARFLGGKKGKLLTTGLATAATFGGAMALTDAVTGGGEEQTQGYSGGGIVSLFDKFGKRKKDSESVDGGRVDGPSGIDKVPAMLTAGEFVMSRGAVQKIGIGKLEAMNAAGGGTNNPKVVDNTVYASVGGYVGDADLGKKGTPDPEKESSGGASNSNFGYRLGQINPETFVMSKEEMKERTSMVSGVKQKRGQGGRVLGSTTARGNLGTRLYENGHLIRSYNKFRNKREYEAPEGIMRALAGIGDLLTGDLFDFDRKTDRGNVFEDRIVHTEMGEDYRVTDDTTVKESIAAIGRPDLIENQQQILKQLPKGTTIQDVMSGAAIPGVTSDQLLRILATSDAQKATNLKEKRARRLDEAIRGIQPGEGYSMSASDMTPALQQAEATANKRHAELMKSTNPEKIAAYDKKHGQGAYSQKLKEKLYRTYGGQATGQTKPAAPTPTGQVVGRENLSPQAQAAIARLEAKKGLPPDMQYTRNGKKISAEEFNRTKNMVGAAKEGGAKGVLNHMLSGVKGMFGGMFSKVQGAVSDPKSFVESMGGTVRDGNIGTPTAEEQKAIDKLNATRARADKLAAQNMAMMNRPKKRIQDDPLFAEYMSIQDDPHHPLFEKVRGGGDIYDFGM